MTKGLQMNSLYYEFIWKTTSEMEKKYKKSKNKMTNTMRTY